MIVIAIEIETGLEETEIGIEIVIVEGNGKKEIGIAMMIIAVKVWILSMTMDVLMVRPWKASTTNLNLQTTP